MRLILASTSPRRREILALLGVPFEVIAPRFDEQLSPHSTIEEEVLDFALGKAKSIAAAHRDGIIIGSDTMISCDGRKIGKPADTADARGILRFLSGKRHRIYTGVAILDPEGPGLVTVEIVDVDMRSLEAHDIDAYLAAGESMDKAGAYSIQGEGRKLLAAIRGDYLAAVGLPLKPIADYLKIRGVKLKREVDEIYRDNALQDWRGFNSSRL